MATATAHAGSRVIASTIRNPAAAGPQIQSSRVPPTSGHDPGSRTGSSRLSRGMRSASTATAKHPAAHVRTYSADVTDPASVPPPPSSISTAHPAHETGTGQYRSRATSTTANALPPRVSATDRAPSSTVTTPCRLRPPGVPARGRAPVPRRAGQAASRTVAPALAARLAPRTPACPGALPPGRIPASRPRRKWPDRRARSRHSCGSPDFPRAGRCRVGHEKRLRELAAHPVDVVEPAVGQYVPQHGYLEADARVVAFPGSGHPPVQNPVGGRITGLVEDRDDVGGHVAVNVQPADFQLAAASVGLVDGLP